MGTYNCPAQNGTSYTPSIDTSATYTIVCDVDQPKGVSGIDGGLVEDINTGTVTYSIEACIDGCVGNNIGGGGCTAVTYGANVTLALTRTSEGISGNCFYKTQRAADFVSDNSGQILSAFLQQ